MILFADEIRDGIDKVSIRLFLPINGCRSPRLKIRVIFLLFERPAAKRNVSEDINNTIGMLLTLFFIFTIKHI